MFSKFFSLNQPLNLWILVLTILLITLSLNLYIKVTTSNYCYQNSEEVPVKAIAIVFGAGIWEDGTPTPMLADRVQGAINLYNIGSIQKILMTGDNSTPDYNEVKAMQEYAINHGVSVEDIILDSSGFSTYKSCYRAKEIFGITQAVLVTQNYHLPRAVYTCRQLGVDVVGLGMPDWGKFRNDSMRRYSIREVFAVLKAFWEVHITRPKPRSNF
ncbi:MAG: YdcF family protein [Trichodesmium sp. St16_bin4-tuft]|nr:YdcF family protein [Trichodesmium sp. MAG_R01]MDE5069322.1 YdcF family protein [Trichodesmium sp. St4_bin8_1]MDE5071975.1 YdcF family protein [Trichodesmium sp. St5_bin8]MDE5078022.1 YdcF family protein [Trichodesmium sp. St2_bin6]MDE5097585.1 YdcF family protein [Trichodesmium sp. St16_bin4-tuft]MDE5102416.1 YdcF family protein [Trichodesmium sp. St19_bin2]